MKICRPDSGRQRSPRFVSDVRGREVKLADKGSTDFQVIRDQRSGRLSSFERRFMFSQFMFLEIGALQIYNYIRVFLCYLY